MYVRKLTLNNFRNHSNATLILGSGINILFGNNAQGKTSILEAIYLAATTRSHRTHNRQEMIKWDQSELSVNLDLAKKYFSTTIDFSISSKTKNQTILIDKLSSNTSNLYGLLNVVFFSQEDLNLIKKDPETRRRFMDIQLCQMDKIYYNSLIGYHSLLKQRNSYLKQNQKNSFNSFEMGYLDIMDDTLSNNAVTIIQRRKNFFEMLNSKILHIHQNISNSNEMLELVYKPNVIAESVKCAMKEKRELDIKSGQTNMGPQRDDFDILINGKLAKNFASQGQQRTAIISMKLAQVQMIIDQLGDPPILLLDDVLAELDINRQKCLFNYTKNIQTLITCTGIDTEIFKNEKNLKVFAITESNIVCKDYASMIY